STSTKVSPRHSRTPAIFSPRRAPRCCARLWGVDSLMCAASRLRPPALERDAVRAPDLLLQLQDAVDERFGGRRTTGHVHVDGHDAIAAAHDRVRIVVV